MYSTLRNHPRNVFVTRGSNVRLEAGCKKIRGVTKPLHKHFFPHFNHRIALTGRSNSGLRIGTLVHRQIEAWATGAPPPLAPARKKGQPRKPYREHRFTKQFKAALQARALKPVMAEYPLLSKHGLYLTYSDLLCQDADGKLVVVSLKTGYGEKLTKMKNNCRGVCKKLHNCQANHHFLQLACEVYTLKHEYGLEVSRAIVLYAGFGKKVTTRGLVLPEWGYSETFMRRVHYVMAQDSPIKIGEMSHIP